MTTFLQLKVGDPIFFVEIEKFKITSGKRVQNTTIKNIVRSNATIYDIGLELENGMKIRVNCNNEAQKIDKNDFSMGVLTELNCLVVATTEKGCKETAIQIAKMNYDAVYKYCTRANANMIRLAALQADSVLLEISKAPASVTTEAVYV